LSIANIFGIKRGNVIFEEVLEAVIQWPIVARDLDIPKERIQYIEKHLRTKF